jgi:hypothetical protein
MALRAHQLIEAGRGEGKLRCECNFVFLTLLVQFTQCTARGSICTIVHIQPLKLVEQIRLFVSLSVIFCAAYSKPPHTL